MIDFGRWESDHLYRAANIHVRECRIKVSVVAPAEEHAGQLTRIHR